MRRFIKKWYPLLIIVLLLAFWFAANAIWHTPPKKTVVVSFDTYSILKAEDQYYLRIHEGADILPKSMSAVPLTSILADPVPKFSSAQHMKQSILNGELTSENLYYIWKHCQFDGDNDFYICNPYEIRIPIQPKGLRANGVYWYGSNYSFSYRASSDYYMSIRCYTLTKEHDVYKAFDSEMQIVNRHLLYTEQVEDRNATVYHYALTDIEPFDKKIMYDLSTEEKPLLILESYYNNTRTIPMDTQFCGIENGVYFIGRITSYNERPTIEFLQSLGISPEPIE